MLRKIIIVLACLPTLAVHAQKFKTRFPVGSISADSTTVIGLGVGLGAVSWIDNKTYGVQLEIFGCGEMTAHADDSYENDTLAIKEIKEEKASKGTYGINIAGIGSICRSCDVHGININGLLSALSKTYGISISGLGNHSEIMYGMQITTAVNSAGIMQGLQLSIGMNDVWFKSAGIQLGLKNNSNYHTGLQIGLFNTAERLRGLQVGIWNVNGKRKLPLLNW